MGEGQHEVGSIPECSCAREPWRDVLGGYLVHAGLRVATRDGRNRMMMILSDEWRAAVARALARSEAMARHPAGSARRPVHLADRMDARRAAGRRSS